MSMGVDLVVRRKQSLLVLPLSVPSVCSAGLDSTAVWTESGGWLFMVDKPIPNICYIS